MHAQDRRAAGFLTRLKRDTRGNTLAIVGAALVPLAAMIGSGLDMSRAYMAKTRLQSACDAASLAARRVMTEDQMNDAVRAEATRFFAFNFPQGLYETDTYALTVTRPQAGSVAITTSTRIPTTIMSMFGIGSLPLNVSCEASLNFVNTDVMLVLDVTGSMGNNLSGTQKIVSLRDAVMALYDELAPVQQQLESNGLRLRYGVVPYSTTVNLDGLMTGANVQFLRESHSYQSRVANYNTEVYVPQDTPITSHEAGLQASPGVQRFRSGGVDRAINNTNCGRFGSNRGFNQSGWEYTSIGPDNDSDVYVPDGSSTAQANAPAAPTGYVRYQFSRNTASWSGNPTDRVCDRNVTVTRRSYETRYKFTNWTFQAQQYDTSGFRAGNQVTIAGNITTSNSGSVATSGAYSIQELPSIVSNVTTTPSSGTLPTVSTSWNGCIEERNTVSTINSSSGFNIPEGALDLDINLAPHDEASRWRPMWPAISYSRSAGSTTATTGSSMSGAPCPAAVRRLQAWDRDTMLTYVNALQPVGNTYHDIGMIWGARLISNGGAFGDSPDTFNGMPVNRHIIFMTDGQMEPSATVYSAYGIENNDQRITGTTGTGNLTNNHLQRFRMICNASRSMNVSVWVIAFGTSLSNDMRNCASNASQASTSGNRDQLIARFRQIGNQIGALRLTQ